MPRAGAALSGASALRLAFAGAGLLAAQLLPASLAGQEPRSLVAGSSTIDSLTARDPVTRSRRAPYQIWSFDARRGQRVVLDMMSSEFDAYLVLRDPDGLTLAQDDDSGEDRNARIRAVLPRDGRYHVVTTAFSAEARGRYSLQLAAWDTPPAAAPRAVVAIRSGESKDGMLEPGDAVGGDGPFEDRWTFDAAAGARLRIELRSTDFDAFLSVLGPDGALLASDDDGLGDKDAVVSVRASVAGRYTAVASSYGDNPVTGTYRLSLADESGNFADPGIAVALAPGETREGRLEAGDPEGRRGFEDRWTFTARAGQVVRLDVMSTQFDPFVVLRVGEVPIDSNDDGGEGTNSRLSAVLPTSGSYTAMVSAYSENRSGGRYRVALTLAPAPAGPGQVARVSPGQQLTGRLETGDRARDNGALEDWWEFDGRSGQDVAIEMRSSAFDAYLELRDSRGNTIAENDDGLASGTDAFILTTLPSNGRYRIVARAYGDRVTTGLYELSMNVAAPASAPGRVTELHPNDLVVGRLEAGDSVVGDSTYADVFIFRADRTGDIVIDLHSGDFDAYLLFQDASGQTLESDDDSGSGNDARITAHATAGQTYRVLANSYGGERTTGAYRITLRDSP